MLDAGQRRSLNKAKARSSRRSAKCSVKDFRSPRAVAGPPRERANEGVEIKLRIAKAQCDLRQDRSQPGRLHTTLRNDFFGFDGRPQRCGHEIEE